MLYTTDTKGQSTPVQVFSEGEYFGFARFALSAPECENYSYERRKVEAGRTYFFTAYVRNEEREIVFNSKNAPQGECIKINFK